MRIVPFFAAAALAFATAAHAQSLDGMLDLYNKLTPHQQDMVAESIHSYRTHVMRTDGSEVTAPSSHEEAEALLANEKVCGAAILELVRRGQLTSSADIASENTKCLNWEFAAQHQPYRVTLTGPDRW